jgi:hypothetical protein
MQIIAHRGNLHGPSPKENHPKQIDECIVLGYAVEIDIWCISDALYLGHDMPRHKISLDFLLSRSESLYVHAKNLPALRKLIGSGLNYFWHQNDAFTLTSHCDIWTYPGQDVTDESIIVCETLDDLLKYCDSEVEGICTDYPVRLESMLVCS